MRTIFVAFFTLLGFPIVGVFINLIFKDTCMNFYRRNMTHLLRDVCFGQKIRCRQTFVVLLVGLVPGYRRISNLRSFVRLLRRTRSDHHVVQSGEKLIKLMDHFARTKTMDKIYVVYPPCDTHEFFSASFKGRSRHIISVGQFRPEKNHKLQIGNIAQ